MPERDDAFMTFDDNTTTLEILTERDGVPYEEYSGIDLQNATTLDVPPGRPFESDPSPREEDIDVNDIPSWLEEDDIEEVDAGVESRDSA